jgi:hypothetical protein
MVPRFFPRTMDEPSGDGCAVLGYGLRGTTDGTDVEQYEQTKREINDLHADSFRCLVADCNPAMAACHFQLRGASAPGKENPASAVRGRVNGEI